MKAYIMLENINSEKKIVSKRVCKGFAWPSKKVGPCFFVGSLYLKYIKVLATVQTRSIFQVIEKSEECFTLLW